jgi:magnesium chelatase family protein
MIYSFSPFGYEGALVAIEIDLRRGIPATDIVGLADGSVKEARERVQIAIRNQGFEYPNERVLMPLVLQI